MNPITIDDIADSVPLCGRNVGVNFFCWHGVETYDTLLFPAWSLLWFGVKNLLRIGGPGLNCHHGNDGYFE